MSRTTKVCLRCGYPGAVDDSAAPAYDRAQLRLRLAQLTALIATLSDERKRLQTISDAIVYPVLSLPPEITSLVFTYCLPESTSLPQPSPLKAPLLLAQICRQWRDIAIATPELWQSIGLIDTRSVGVFETWLARSGNHPLDLSLHCVDPDRAGSLIDVCIPHAHRWRDVGLALPIGLLTRLENLPPMPVLRRISLSLAGPFRRERSDSEAECPIPLLTVPRLCDADISTYPDLRFDLPWGQLATLTLAKLEVAECFAIFNRCPDLVTLDISTTSQITTALAIGDEPIALPLLESFTFSTGFCSVIHRLRLPRLSHLHIRETIAANTTHTSCLQALIQHSAAPIQRLSLTLKYPASDTISCILAAMPPSLRTLELHCGNATHIAPILAALQPPALPTLTALSITGGRVFDADYDAFPALLQARVDTLREFTLLIQTYERPDAVREVPLHMRALPRFRALADGGMKIRFAIAGRFHVGMEVLIDT
ncbi:hypothetical protein DFH06DRAFT_1068165 [Mycena polygramma]|nr:hypothetical protein DFH06DRAFT_1068165 [Mycena polygramma]